MLNFLDDLFKEATPLRDVYGNALARSLNETGGLMISFGFLAFGIICVLMAGFSYPKSNTRTLSTKLFGWSLIGCGLSRGFEVYSYWHNYPVLGGFIKIATGLTILATLFLLPRLLKETLRHRSLMEIEERMKATAQKVETAIKLTEELKSEK